MDEEGIAEMFMDDSVLADVASAYLCFVVVVYKSDNPLPITIFRAWDIFAESRSFEHSRLESRHQTTLAVRTSYVWVLTSWDDGRSS